MELNEDDIKPTIEALESPIAFCKTFLKMEPFSYQKEFLEDKCKEQIFKSGRQVGKSTMTAVKALHRAFSRPKEVILIIAPVFRQSALLFDKVLELTNANDILKAYIIRETRTLIQFRNGSVIHCLPAGRTGYGVKGYSATLLIVDEAAFVPDEVFVSIVPSLAATDGEMILISTPFGKRGYFYESWVSEGYSKHQAKSSDSPLISKSFIDAQKVRMSELEFLQEFEGEFTEESDTFFPRDLVMRCLEVDR